MDKLKGAVHVEAHITFNPYSSNILVSENGILSIETPGLGREKNPKPLQPSRPTDSTKSFPGLGFRV